MKKSLSLILLILHICIFLAVANANVYAARTVALETDKLQTELDAVDLQIDYLNLKVKDSQNRINNLERKLKQKKSEIKTLEQQINTLNDKQLKHAERIKALETETALVQQNISELVTRYRARLVQLHKIKQGTLLGSVFSAKNLNSFLNRFQMVKYLLENDKKMIEELKSRAKRLKQINKERQQKRREHESGKKELDEKRKRVRLENSSLQAMLKTLVLEKKLFLQKEQKLKASKAQLQKEIDKIEASRKTQQGNFESELANTPARPAPQIQAPLPDSAPEAAKVMQFSWPIKSNLIKSIYNVGDTSIHAILIETDQKCEVTAAGRGKVLYKGAIGGLGNVIILGHQKGFSSVYANLDDIWVGMGQIVDQRETIGRILAANRSLHFEIRFGGKKQSPRSYLPPIDLPE